MKCNQGEILNMPSIQHIASCCLVVGIVSAVRISHFVEGQSTLFVHVAEFFHLRVLEVIRCIRVTKVITC
jgi:hypothetical protein